MAAVDLKAYFVDLSTFAVAAAYQNNYFVALKADFVACLWHLSVAPLNSVVLVVLAAELAVLVAVFVVLVQIVDGSLTVAMTVILEAADFVQL